MSRDYYRHGLTNHPDYGLWHGILQRCNNPHDKTFYKYGARGISVCERWSRFDCFLADMGPRPSGQHSIDRIDNDGDYKPENCRWATAIEQANNRRTNRLLTYKGKTLTLIEWVRNLGLNEERTRSRAKRHWSVERILGN